MSRTMKRRSVTINGTLADLAGVTPTLTEKYGIPPHADVVDADFEIDHVRTVMGGEYIDSSLHLVFEWPDEEVAA